MAKLEAQKAKAKSRAEAAIARKEAEVAKRARQSEAYNQKRLADADKCIRLNFMASVYYRIKRFLQRERGSGGASLIPLMESLMEEHARISKRRELLCDIFSTMAEKQESLRGGFGDNMGQEAPDMHGFRTHGICALW